MEGIAPYKRHTPRPVASPSEALSAAAQAGYECGVGSGIPQAHAPTQLTRVKGYGSNRSREGSHPSSSGRWPAERGRRRAGASGLARSKGPPAPRDDDGREQEGNFTRPRSRPHVLISGEPSATNRHRPRYPAADGGGADTEQAAACAGQGPLPKEKPRRRRGSKFWDERAQRVVELVPPAPMRNLAWGSALCIKIFRRPPPVATA